MKKLLYIFSGVLLSIAVSAQDPSYPPAPATPLNVVAAEYFIDTDPGFGSGTVITVTAGIDISNIAATINTAGLTIGAHRLFVRTRSSDGKWSLAGVREFLYNFDYPYTAAPAAVQNITSAEYFIDTEPGIGNGVNIPIVPAADLNNTAAVINTTGLSTGIHRLYIRTRGNEGRWSITGVKDFLLDFNPAYPASPAVMQNVAKAEYFIDTDPGIGNGINITLTPGVDINNIAINPSLVGLSNGTHRMYVRSRSNEGNWTITGVKDFLYDADPQYVSAPAAAGNIVKAEYFFDTDPGFGSATPVTITPGVDISNIGFAANTSALADGNHVLFVRSLDDWSVAGFVNFVKGAPLPLRFLSVAAFNKPASVDVQWKTDNEINTSHFDVERSEDGVRFERVGSVSAANTAGVHQYAFTDTHPLDKTGYYRLKQVDKDGKSEYSKVLVVNRLPANAITFYPNPAKDIINFVMPQASNIKTISIVDTRGVVLKQVTVNGATKLSVNISQLAHGIYFIRFGDEQSPRRFFK